MQGVSQHTFQPLGGFEHVVQSIHKIITTPLGSRVMRRDFGSKIPGLLDAPLNDKTRLDFIIGVAEALDRWEPRVRLETVTLVDANEAGIAAIDLLLTYADDGQTITARIEL